MRTLVRSLALVSGLLACSAEDTVGPASHESSSEAPVAGFVDETSPWGLDFVHDKGATDERQLLETMGHGVALFDANEDGALDLYLVQGGDYRARDGRAVNRLYLNERGSLRDVTSDSGAAADPGYGMGVAVGDGDGDGHLDLALTNFGRDRWLAGDGRGSFESREVGIVEDRWTTAVTFFDPDADGDLDLFVVAYVAIDLDDPPWCGRREDEWRTVCSPDEFPGLDDRLWLNDGGGRFTDGTSERGIAPLGGKGLGVAAFDMDDDGWTDVYVANDSTENHLWRNLGDGSFEDFTVLAGVGVNRFGATEAGMGVAVGDLDGDLLPEIVVTNFDHESHSIYRNEGSGLFLDATPEFGVEAATRMPVGFGVVSFDADGDRDLDLALVNGHVVERIALYDDAQTWRQRAQLFRNDAGRLRLDDELGGDFAKEPRVGRGLAVGDLDGDGDEDLVATECGGRARIFVNPGAPTDVLRVRGLEPGARVRATYADGVVVVREAANRASYLSASSSDVLLPTQSSIERLELRDPGAEWRAVEVEPIVDAAVTRSARSDSSDR